MKFYGEIEQKGNSDHLALLLPGYTGGSGAFSSILHLLDCDVVSVTYPGHGIHYRDFDSTTASDWKDCVSEKIRKSRKRYEDILLIGYSMGGALALLQDKDLPKLLLSPAITPKDYIPEDVPDEKPITLDAVNPRLKLMCDNQDLDVIRWFLKADNHRSQVELNRIESEVEAISCRDFPHTYAFIGEKDPVIPYSRSSKWLSSHGIEYMSFRKSTHAILYDAHSADVVEAVREVLSKDKRLQEFARNKNTLSSSEYE